MREIIPTLITIAGIGQLSVLVASALVPIRLEWHTELKVLPRLHQQMYWTYGGYIVLSIVALGIISLINAEELAGGSCLARSFCAYAAVFWEIRFALQAVLDVKAYLTAWWLIVGEFALTILVLYFTAVFATAALLPT
jgi:hypothetical protein